MTAPKFYDYSKSPHASGQLRLIVTGAHRLDFRSATQKFGDDRGMTVLFRLMDPTGSRLAIDLWNVDFDISGSNDYGVDEFQIAFYTDPKTPDAAALIQKLMADFQAAMSAVPGVTVSKGR